jgi:hypothetical protein
MYFKLVLQNLPGKTKKPQLNMHWSPSIWRALTICDTNMENDTEFNCTSRSHASFTEAVDVINSVNWRTGWNSIASVRCWCCLSRLGWLWIPAVFFYLLYLSGRLPRGSCSSVIILVPSGCGDLLPSPQMKTYMNKDAKRTAGATGRWHGAAVPSSSYSNCRLR